MCSSFSFKDTGNVEIRQGLTSESPLLVEGNSMETLGGNYTSRDGFYISAAMNADNLEHKLFFTYGVYKELSEGIRPSVSRSLSTVGY